MVQPPPKGLSLTTHSIAKTCAKCNAIIKQDAEWCDSCVSAYIENTDPWLIFQSQSSIPANVVARARLKQVERLRDFVVQQDDDEEFLPLLQFMGSRPISQQRATWNFLHAMYLFEVETTADAYRMGNRWPNLNHMCGRHAPMDRSVVTGFLSRINSAKGDFKPFKKDPHFVDYIRGFVSDNRLFIGTYRRTAVDLKRRAADRYVREHYGKAKFDRHSPPCWPFEGRQASELRENGEMEELPDIVMQVAKLIPSASMPESLREDLCQDLVVAVLSGEISIDELRIEMRMKWYVQQAFKNHPLRYGRFTIDQRAPRSYDTVGDLLSHEDTCNPRHKGWLDNVDDLGPSVFVPECDDNDVRDVMLMEQHPQWRRKFYDKTNQGHHES